MFQKGGSSLVSYELGRARLGQAWLSYWAVVLAGMGWSGPGWAGMGWAGLAWVGLSWAGLGWFALG